MGENKPAGESLLTYLSGLGEAGWAAVGHSCRLLKMARRPEGPVDTLIVNGFMTAGFIRATMVEAASYNYNVTKGAQA